MLGVGITVDREAVRGEPGRADHRHPGQGGQNMAAGAGEQRFQVRLERGDVSLQRLMPGEVTAQPFSAWLSVSWRGKTAPPRQEVSDLLCKQWST